MNSRGRAALKGLLALLSALVLFVTGYGWHAYQSLSSGLTKSDALTGTGTTSTNGDTNILVMGLDSRLDQNGNPLPRDVLAQLHAGDSSDGGYNTNVLMLLHVPGDGSRAQAISIPRDDYVTLPNDPDGVHKQKIKQAYGLAKDAAERELRARGVVNQSTLEQQGREAGRKEELETVEDFLGGVSIDHFVEVTLVGFYDLAKALGSVTVCLAGPTQDSYSGAKFVKGHQQLDAAQALAFVRQRRDYVHPDLNFTDLDRERRQQAFLSSAAYQLRSAGTFADPARLDSLIDVAKRDVVIDSEFDLLRFLQQSQPLLDGNITFTTLPVKQFSQVDGQDVNLVDLEQVRATVRSLINPDDATAPAGTTGAQLPAATLDVVNASGRNGLAATLERQLTARGLTQGSVRTERTPRTESTVSYSAGSKAAATALAAALGGLPVEVDPNLPSGHERLLVGSDFTPPADLDGAAGTDEATLGSPSPATPAAPVSSLQGGGIPCVK
ncbi:MAG TPA: LCP family protein [Pseudonocardia sp.]|nr:LCP family protein [Pseudonocardia sp.]